MKFVISDFIGVGYSVSTVRHDDLVRRYSRNNIEYLGRRMFHAHVLREVEISFLSTREIKGGVGNLKRDGKVT